MTKHRTATERLQEDLVFAAPEVWHLHIQRRFEEAAEEAVAAYRAELAEQVRGLDDNFLACGGFGCSEERTADFRAVLALIEPTP